MFTPRINRDFKVITIGGGKVRMIGYGKGWSKTYPLPTASKLCYYY